MLKYRLIFGSLMAAGVLGLCYLDHLLDQVDLTGTWLQPLFAGRTYLPSGLLLLALFLVLIVLAAGELCRMFRAKGLAVDPLMVNMAGLAGCLLLYMAPHRMDSQATMAVFATLAVVLFLATVLRFGWISKRIDGASTAAGITALALIYLGLLPGFYVMIRRWHTIWLIAAIILITKACDIGAYFTGRYLGKHQLIPWLSPKKTWEGFIGGVLLSGAVAATLAAINNLYAIDGIWISAADDARRFVHVAYPIIPTAVAGMLIGAVGQFGDLVASLFKRDTGIKDSGSSIPGFGGVMDVVDSPLVTAPLAYWLVILAQETA